MTRRITALACAAALLASAALADIAAPTGRTLVTVGGDLPAGNAPGGTMDEVTFSGFLDLEYAVAVAFDEAMLADLPQHEVAAQLLDSDRVRLYSGPRLSAVMQAAGAGGMTAAPMAFDGYQVEIEWDMLTQYEPILATHIDGAPMAIGKLGPAMVVFPVVEDAELYESFEFMQVWAAFFIGAIAPE